MNIMVEWKNLEKTDNIVKCDLYIEDSDIPQRFAVDIRTKEIIQASLPDGYEYCKGHLAHAYKKIIELAENGELPSEYTIMWY